jgi:hypothetical protein
MWYPTVRRTLVCLSRLYRCVDRPIFQGLSQEALTYCIQSVSSAATAISAKKVCKSFACELFFYLLLSLSLFLTRPDPPRRRTIRNQTFADFA